MRGDTIFDVRRRINHLRSLSKTPLDPLFIRDRVSRLIDAYPWRVVSPIISGIFRARINEGQEFFSNSAELWHPPARFVNKGRFNLPNDPIFYACSQFNGAVFETRPEEGNEVTVLLATPTVPSSPIRFASIGMGKIKIPEIQIYHSYNNPPFNKNTWNAIDDWISEVSTGDSSQYDNTNALSYILRTCEHIEGFFYPSVALNLNAINIAMKVENADRLFEAKHAFKLQVVKKINDPNNGYPLYKIFISHHSQYIDLDGNIEWQTTKPGDIPRIIFHTRYVS